MATSERPYRQDILTFLILIPLISAINYYLTYSNIELNGFLLLTFTIDTVQGYGAWWAVRWIVIRLDQRMPYENNPARRIGIQFLLTTAAGLFVISGLTELVSWIAKGKAAPLSFYTHDLVIISIWFFVLNGIYIGFYYYNAWGNSELKREEENKIRGGGFTVKQGKQEILLRFEDLIGFLVDGDYVMACEKSGKKFYLDQSLDKIEKVIPSVYFFRLTRQHLVHHQLVEGFKRLEQGKILVMLFPNPFFTTEITVSRLKAPAFKEWFRPAEV